MLLVFLGAPGSGKGTTSKKMVDLHGYKHISTGDIFREVIKENTPLGKRVKKIIESGELVDDKTTWEVARHALEQNDLENEKIILDGFPRNIEQAKMLEDWLLEKKLDMPKPQYFEVSLDVILQRLSGRLICSKCGRVYNVISDKPKVKGKCDFDGADLYQREDDKIENVETRLKTYRDVTEPLVKFYADRGDLILINGEASSETTAEISLSFAEELKN